MNLVFLLRCIGCACFFFAAIGSVWEASRPWGGHIGWLGVFFYALTFLG